MKIEIQLSEEDFLTYHLYNASISKRIKKRRQRNKNVVPILYLLIGGLLYFYPDSLELSIFFVAVGILWFFAYPNLEKHRYIRVYRESLQDNYKERFGKTVSIEFTKEYIFANDSSSECKTKTNHIESFIEIPALILMKFKDGNVNIIPKDKIEDLNTFVSMLKEMAADLNIEYKLENNWKWK